MIDLKSIALQALRDLERDFLKSARVNKEIHAWQNDDFPTVLHSMTPALESAFIGVLDEVLGGGIASYYLYEATSMKGGGKVIEDGKEWPIKNISDVKRYVMRKKP